MEKKAGYRTITYKFRLECNYIDWIYATKAIYNNILFFYYEVIKNETELLELNSQQMMRRLELLTVGSREESIEDVKYPIPYQKIPLYFRRAAINDAIRLYRSYVTGENNGVKHAGRFQASPIYYKGMYRNFSEDNIELKLYDGEKWQWIFCFFIYSALLQASDIKQFIIVLLQQSGTAITYYLCKQSGLQGDKLHLFHLLC